MNPDFGLAPQPISAANTCNSNLVAQLDLLDQWLAAEIVQFHTNAAFRQLLQDPSAFGFSNTTQACVDNSGPVPPRRGGLTRFWQG